MSTHVLVAYATRYGSTAEVATQIAETLRERGLIADIQHAREVRSLNAYGAVVLGAPIYVGTWHKEALHFLSQYREQLAQRPLAIFALGPIHDSSAEEEWKGSRASLDAELAKVPGLTPVSVEVFGGKYDPGRLRFLDNLLTVMPASPLHDLPATDARDWTAIRAWANDLADRLQPALQR